MQLIEKGQLRPGMILGQDICSYGKQIVLKKGTVLDKRSIDRLGRYDVRQVMIDDIVIGTYEADSYYRTSYSKRVQASPEFKRFQKDYDNQIQDFQGILNRVVEQNQEMDIEALYQQVIHLLQDTGNTMNAFDMLQNLRHYDDSTYAHCMNVGLLANVFAKWLGFSEEDRKTVTLAGILHDIGKTKMPLEIIQKPGRLTEEEYTIIKGHTEVGYQILEQNRLNYHIRNAALMHHERNDGSGYPEGRKGHQIDIFAKVVSIVDVYDAMTSPRVYRGPMCPFDVIDIFVREGLQKYESEYILTFLKRIAETYMNETVRLSDGRKGRIIYISNHAPSRPTILVGEIAVDLRREKQLTIAEIL